MLGSLGIFAVLIILSRAKLPSGRQIFHQLVGGSLIHAAYQGGVYAAIKLQMPVAVASLLVGLQPIMTALIIWLVLAGQLQRQQWFGLLFGLICISMILLVGEELGQFEITLNALLAALIALIGISIGTIYQKYFGANVDLLFGTFFQYLATAFWMATLTYAFEQQVVEWHPHLIGALVWLVLGLSVSFILLLMHMIREGEVAKVTSYFYLIPPLT